MLRCIFIWFECIFVLILGRCAEYIGMISKENRNPIKLPDNRRGDFSIFSVSKHRPPALICRTSNFGKKCY